MNVITPTSALATRAIPAETKAFDARDLIGAGNTAQIVLDDQLYVLRITRAGKLILTK